MFRACRDCKYFVGYLQRGGQAGLCNKFIDEEETKRGNTPDLITGRRPKDDDWFHDGHTCSEAREKSDLCGEEAKGFEPKPPNLFYRLVRFFGWVSY